MTVQCSPPPHPPRFFNLPARCASSGGSDATAPYAFQRDGVGRWLLGPSGAQAGGRGLLPSRGREGKSTPGGRDGLSPSRRPGDRRRSGGNADNTDRRSLRGLAPKPTASTGGDRGPSGGHPLGGRPGETFGPCEGGRNPNRERCRRGVLPWGSKGAEHPSPAPLYPQGVAWLVGLNMRQASLGPSPKRLSGHRPHDPPAAVTGKLHTKLDNAPPAPTGSMSPKCVAKADVKSQRTVVGGRRGGCVHIHQTVSIQHAG